MQQQQQAPQFQYTPTGRGGFANGLGAGLAQGFNMASQRKAQQQNIAMLQELQAQEQAQQQAQMAQLQGLAQGYGIDPAAAADPDLLRQLVVASQKPVYEMQGAQQKAAELENALSVLMNMQQGGGQQLPEMPQMGQPQTSMQTPQQARNMGGGVMMEYDPNVTQRQTGEPLMGGVSSAAQSSYGQFDPRALATVMAFGGSGSDNLVKGLAAELFNQRTADQVAGLNPAKEGDRNTYRLFAGFNPISQAEIDLPMQRFGETQRHNKVTEGISGGQLGVARGNLGLRGQEFAWRKQNPASSFIIPIQAQGGSGGFGGVIPLRKPGQR